MGGPVVAQLAAAASHGERAAILLRLPDVAIHFDCPALHRVCMAAGFRQGISFLALRLACLNAVRTLDGRLPRELGDALDETRAMLADLSALERSA